VSIDGFLTQFVEWAEHRDDVHGVLLVGSRARTETPADQWSDIDLVLVVENPDRYLRDEHWLEAFGRPILTLLEPTPIGGTVERRILFETGLDVDIAVFTLAAFERAVDHPDTAGVLARGNRVLLDRVRLAETTARALSVARPTQRLPDSQVLREHGADFWYHALWTAKKLARGELLMATRSVDGYLKERLIALLGWHARARNPTVDIWHDARFFEQWADPRALDSRRDAYARYDKEDVARALVATADIFELFERETTAALGLGESPRREDVRILITATLEGHSSGTRDGRQDD
jgi:aminoglycoside 6-adenylyltransferase